MQSFTRDQKAPRTALRSSYPVPPLGSLKKREHFIPEPDRRGRQCNPDADTYKPFINCAHMRYNPVNNNYRNKKMTEMLQFINQVNWTTSRHAKMYSPRSEPSTYSHPTFKKETTHRLTYIDHHMGRENRQNPERKSLPGITPNVYHVRPYDHCKDNRLTVKHYHLSTIKTHGKKSDCKITVPHYIPAPFPGPKYPEAENQ